MTKAITYINELGILTILIAAEKARNHLETDDDFFKRIALKDVPFYRSFVLKDDNGKVIENDQDAKKRIGIDDLEKQLDFKIIDIDGNFPNNRDFRNAWEHIGDKVSVNISKARDIHMNNLRALRQKKFEGMGFATKPNPDIEKLLSSETQNTLKNLRDIPQIFDLSSATTPDELKLLIPENLKE